MKPVRHHPPVICSLEAAVQAFKGALVALRLLPLSRIALILGLIFGCKACSAPVPPWLRCCRNASGALPHAATLCQLFALILECNYVTLSRVQHSRPYRPLVHDLVGLQRNVSSALPVSPVVCGALRFVRLCHWKSQGLEARSGAWCRHVSQRFVLKACVRH